jgi:DoxX
VIIRLAVGAVYFLEGVKKILFVGQWGTGRFARIGIPNPQFMAQLVGSIEVVCGPVARWIADSVVFDSADHGHLRRNRIDQGSHPAKERLLADRSRSPDRLRDAPGLALSASGGGR